VSKILTDKTIKTVVMLVLLLLFCMPLLSFETYDSVKLIHE